MFGGYSPQLPAESYHKASPGQIERAVRIWDSENNRACAFFGWNSHSLNFLGLTVRLVGSRDVISERSLLEQLFSIL